MPISKSKYVDITSPGASGAPVYVPEPPSPITLQALTVTPNSATVGSSYNGTVLGRTNGSLLSLSGPGAAGLTLDSGTGAITGTPTTAGAVNVTEFLSGAVNSPRSTNNVVTIAEATPTPVFASSRLRPADRNVALSATFFSCLFAVTAVTPNRRLKNPRVQIPGFASNNTGAKPTEIICPNQFGVAYSLEMLGVRYRAMFAGQPWTTRGGAGSLYGESTPFDVGILSDVMKDGASDLILPPNTPIRHLSIVRLALSTDVFPASQVVTVGGTARNSTDPTGAALEPLLSGNAAIVQSGSGPTGSFAPAYMVAEDADTGEVISFLLTGDSRFYGVGDFGSGLPASQSAGALQSGQRAMVALGFPYANISIPGSQPDGDCVHRYASINQVRAVFGKDAFTHSISNHGNNSDMTIAVNLVELADLKAAFPNPNIKWGKATLPPRIGTGGDYRTVGGQTPAAIDQWPSGARATLTAAQLANDQPDPAKRWDFVIDLGKYGSAAKDLPYADVNFNDRRAKFPVGPSTTLAKAWTASALSIYMVDQTIKVNDFISVGSTFVRNNIMGPVTAVTDNGDGSFKCDLQSGSVPTGVSYSIGDPVTRVATRDGTHEGPWVSVLEAQAIIDWNTTGRPAKYPANA